MGDVVSIDVDEAQQIIRVTVTGLLTDAVVIECSKKTRATPEFQKGYALLLDLSGVTKAEVSSQVIVRLAQGAQKDRNRVAILARDITVFGMARIYEMIADLKERRVRVYTDEQLAMEWLTR